MKSKLESLIIELNEFVKERNWDQFHHRKSIVMCLCVEISELFENFIQISTQDSFFIMQDPKYAREIQQEIGDVFNCFLLLSNLFNLNILQISSQVSGAPFETIEELQMKLSEKGSREPPKSLISELVVRSGRLMEHFLWVKEEEINAKPATDEFISSFMHVFFCFLALCDQLGIDPIVASQKKLVILREKYPVEIVKGSLSNYLQRKKSLKK